VVLTCPERRHVDHALDAHRLGTLADLSPNRRIANTERENGERGENGQRELLKVTRHRERAGRSSIFTVL
jgi:hypothetical protein